MSSKPEYYTPEELSIKLNVSRKTITKWTQSRRIPGQVKAGGMWRYRINEVEKKLLSGEFLLPTCR